MAKIKNKQFPKKELNTWLRVNSKWNHKEWASLIDDLCTQVFHEWTDTEQGLNEISFLFGNQTTLIHNAGSNARL